MHCMRYCSCPKNSSAFSVHFCLANENKSCSNICSLMEAGVHALECKVIQVTMFKGE